MKFGRPIFYLFILFQFAPVYLFSQPITEIIKPLKLTSGKEIPILLSDLFYAGNYNPKFDESNEINIHYDHNANTINLKTKDFVGLTTISFEFNDEMYDIPVISKKEEIYKFSYKPEKKFKNLSLFGSFNGWNRHDIPMIDDNGDGIYEAEVALEPGIYQYKFFGDGEEIVDPENPTKVPNGFGDFNSVRTIEAAALNEIFLHSLNYENTADQIRCSFVAESAKNIILNKDQVLVLLNNKKIEPQHLSIQGAKITASIPKKMLGDKDVLRAVVSLGGSVSNMQHVFLFNGKPAGNENFTWYDGIIYSLMIDRFNDGDKSLNDPVKHYSLSNKANYMGGDLQGIINKLNDGYFDSLGINVLWISPVYDNPNEAFREYPEPHRFFSGYHGYWPINHQRIEEKFGDINKLKELVTTAHKYGIKVLLDFVSNHVHEQHPWFIENRNWFGNLELPDGRLNLRFWDEYRLTTWFEPYLPSFDFLGAPGAIEAVTDNAVWWLEQTGADGFRHDAVKHVPNEFWRELSRKIKEKISASRENEIYQIGETFGSYMLISSYVNNGQLNSQFNFNLYDVALPTFIDEENSFSALNKEMQKTFSVYGELHLMGNIMDSHDKNRFMAFADGDLDVSQWSAVEIGWNNPPQVDDYENYKKLILYMTYMNTIPGLPVVYYGSEFGMSGASDPDNRRMMRFGSELSYHEKRTLKQVREIINYRKKHSPLRYGDFFALIADENIYTYVRSDMNERIVVAMNKSNTEQLAEFNLPDYYHKKEMMLDLQTNKKVTPINKNYRVIIPPMSYKIFKVM